MQGGSFTSQRGPVLKWLARGGSARLTRQSSPAKPLGHRHFESLQVPIPLQLFRQKELRMAFGKTGKLYTKESFDND